MPHTSDTIMQFINLTPHALNIKSATGEWVTIPTSGNSARIATTDSPRGSVAGIDTFTTVLGAIEGLPEPVSGVALIVSGMVGQAANRVDVFSPGVLVRDDSGRPTGCVGLQCYAAIR